MIKKENNHQPQARARGDKVSKKEENTIKVAEAASENSAQKMQEVSEAKFTPEQIDEPCGEKEKLAQIYYEQLVRLKAEFENYRKRVEREQETHRERAKEEILIKQISLLDIMEQALSAAKNTQDISAIVKGLEMIVKEFEKMLSDEGVSVVGTEGIFDTSRHEVIETVEDMGLPDGTVREVVAKGYAINGRVIRPAKVKIVKNHTREALDKGDKL